MEENFNLNHKSDSHLLSELKILVTQEREVLSQILHYIKEVEARRLYLAKGYSSLFSFLTGELAYSESAAQRRIQAMRLIRDLPEVQEKIEKGTLSLSVAAQIQGFMQNEDKKRQGGSQERLSSEEILGLVQKLAGISARKCELQLAQMAPETKLPKEKTKPLTPERTLIQFLAFPRLLGKIQRLKTLLSHSKPEGTLEDLFEKAMDLALEKLDPERREARRKKSKGNNSKSKIFPPPTSAPRGPPRHIPQALRDRIWLRDKGRCQYRDPRMGKLCGSQIRLEVDHRYPFSLGGEHCESNLRLRCRDHNQFHASEIFNETGPHLSPCPG